MTSLRSRLVEAGARAMHVRTGKPRGPIEPFILDAEAVLDATLDCLAENVDEWAEGTRVPLVVGGDALALIAALREDR